ncbi:MAG: hypothetical protein FWD46_02140 [Cystobacterineae bacterium]|nr:hypothetical protein [Cystobacterineae bacterium]
MLMAFVATLFFAEEPISHSKNDGFVLLPNAKLVRWVARSHLSLVADLYWLKAIHVAGGVNSSEEARELFSYGNFIAELDQKLLQNYWLTGLNLPFQTANGWENAELASQIYERGLGSFPHNTKLLIYYASNELFYRQDQIKSANLLMELSKNTDAPPYAGMLATRILAQNRNFDAALDFMSFMHEMAADDMERELLEKRMKEIELEQLLVVLDNSIDEFQKQYGRIPKTPEELLSVGLLSRLPEEPFGKEFYIHSDGKAYSTSISSRLQMFSGK